MNGKERLEAVFSGKIPDKVPHFELDFQIPEKAFGKSWPTQEQYAKASEKEREHFFNEYFDIWEKIVEKYDWSAIVVQTNIAGFFEGKVYPEVRRRFGNKVMVFPTNGNGTFWMPTGNDMMDFIIKLFEQPEEIHRQAKEKMRCSIELAKYQVDQGADFICITSDYAYNSGPFVSPKMFSEFVTPYLTEIVDKMHQFGTKVLLHSDGDLREILGQLVSTGIDGYQSIDPQGNMDIAEVKRFYGDRLVLMGNVQTAYLQDINESRIRKSVDYCMTNGKPDGRYIFSTSNCLFAGMPVESYHIMLNEYEKKAWY